MLTALFWKIHDSTRCQNRGKKAKMVNRRQIFTFNSLRPVLAVEWYRTRPSPIFDDSEESVQGPSNWCLWANRLRLRKMRDKRSLNQKEIFQWNFTSPSVCKIPLFSVVVDTVFTYIVKHKNSRNFRFSLMKILTSLEENCLLNCVPSSTGFRKM